MRIHVDPLPVFDQRSSVFVGGYAFSASR